MIPFSVSHSGVITAFANGKLYPFAPDHHKYKEVLQALENDDAAALERYSKALVDLVASYSEGHISVKDGVVSYDGEQIDNSFTQRIIELAKQKFPCTHLIKFLDNLMENPSMHSVNELYDFLQHWALPITPDGCFLAYKRVKDDYTDFHTGKYDNRVGAKPFMRRNAVDDIRSNFCSKGFHVGAIEYVRNFASGGHVMICKVNPRDAVSVPTDHNCTKLRVNTYEVVGEYDRDLVDSPVYTEKGEPLNQDGEVIKKARTETTNGFEVFDLPADKEFDGFDPNEPMPEGVFKHHEAVGHGVVASYEDDEEDFEEDEEDFDDDEDFEDEEDEEDESL